MRSKLSKHQKVAHAKNKRVEYAVSLKKKPRINEFRKFRREGIIMFNKEEARKEQPQYQSERKKRKYFDIVLCSCCSAFVSQRFFHSHKRNCDEENDSCASGIPMYLQDLPYKSLQSDFVTDVLSKIRNDEIGRVIRGDPHILFLGDKFYRLSKHKKEKSATVRKSVRGQIRLLASLYNVFTSLDDIEKIHDNIMDMFCRENFDNMCIAIERLTTGEDDQMKAGLRKNLSSVLTRSCKQLRDHLFLQKKEVESNELGAYLKCLKSNRDLILSSANYKLELTRL